MGMKGKIMQKIDTNPRRVLAGYYKKDEAKWRKIRIHFDWTRVEEQAANKEELTEKMNYMKKILKTVEDYFSTRFEVKSKESFRLGTVKKCSKKPVPEHLQNKKHEKDLVIVIDPSNEETSWFAAAGACVLDGEGRP